MRALEKEMDDHELKKYYDLQKKLVKNEVFWVILWIDH
ncbi:unnamed protein product (macronuclear) [Paramecium tetraurelia]|uniref:Uncharacterized protein n=1 Tax=Paramecium tetraurelia TaxID=5888 RepID=A0CF85_PARTE|nr:uncharacterized protein GSPATT00037891001 [Paramecium tetraurelia]CAK69452.1 unnamed protein product [Paramecium tetraurelia]|eukprot:XP_001436849.1 hypothetical protein (macronuclear) [Paramecium tetraurelia strain d4-2]